MKVLFPKKYFTPYWNILYLHTLLFLVWPLVHTIALRKLLLLITAGIGIYMLFRHERRVAILNQPWLKLMGLLLLWTAVHAAFISQNSDAWKEFFGQWFTVYVALFAGIGLGLVSTKVAQKKYCYILLASALAIPVAYLVVNLYEWINLGYLPVGFMKPREDNDVRLGMDLKTSLTFSVEMLAAFSSGHLLNNWKQTGRGSLGTIWMLPIILALLVGFVSESKNLIILTLLNLILLVIVQGFRNGAVTVGRLMLWIFAIVLCTTLTIQNSISANKIWKRGLSDIRISLDIDKYDNWKNFLSYGLPENEFGEELPETLYLRLAYAHAGLRAALENPWGYGVTRKAMEDIEKEKYPDIYISNAHNGYLNLSCAVGIPGLLLFVFAMIAVISQLVHSNSKWALPAIWMIGLYLVHWFVDAIDRDHFIQLFIYVVALMTTLALVDRNEDGQC